MRFDNIANAAMTPGGFQAGVNDIVQAILGADRAKQQLAAQQEQQSWDRGMAEKTLGQNMANNLASQGFREREVKANEMRAETDRALAGNTVANTWADNTGSVLKYLGDKFIPDAKAGAVTSQQDLAERKFAEDQKRYLEEKNLKEDTEWVNNQVYKNTEGQPYREEPELAKDPIGRYMPDPTTGKYQTTGKTIRTKRDKTDAELSRERSLFEDRKKQREWRQATKPPGSAVLDAQVSPPQGDTNGLGRNDAPKSMGSQVAGSMGATAPAPSGLGSQVAGAMATSPVIDYDAEDARLQATSDQYRQLRSNPGFNWKAAVDAAVQKRQQPR